MNSDVFEARMRALESYHSIKFPPNTWVIIRVDGRSFSRFTEVMKFQKPFDSAFAGHMINTARALVEEFQAVYAFTESDEISLLLPPSWDLFDRELEKVVSVSAAAAASKLTDLISPMLNDRTLMPRPIMFDSRVCICPNQAAVTDYFRWRQSDANRCAINGYCYWTLRQEGLSARKATSQLENKSQEAKWQFLQDKGVIWDQVPGWQKNGVGVYWTTYTKDAKNQKTGEAVKVTRRTIKTDHELPVREKYEEFLRTLTADANVVPV